MTTKPAQYTPDFKLEVLDYSDRHTPREAIDKFDLDPQTVHQWRHLRNKGKLRLPTNGEAVAALAHRGNGNGVGKHKYENGKLPRGAKARIFSAVYRGQKIKAILLGNPDLNAKIVKGWVREAKKAKKENKNLPVVHRDAALAHRMAGGAGHQQPAEFQASADTIMSRLETLEFLLAFLKH